MGFIPIFVALLGASLLYTIYTVSHINGHVKRIKLNKAQFKSNLIRLRELASHSDMKDLQTELADRPTDDFQDFESENQWITQQLTKTSIDDLKNEMFDKLKEQKALTYKLRGLIRDYNLYIAKSPAIWVAKLWGFRKI